MLPESALNSDKQASRRDSARVCKVSGVFNTPECYRSQPGWQSFSKHSQYAEDPRK